MLVRGNAIPPLHKFRSCKELHLGIRRTIAPYGQPRFLKPARSLVLQLSISLRLELWGWRNVTAKSRRYDQKHRTRLVRVL